MSPRVHTKSAHVDGTTREQRNSNEQPRNGGTAPGNSNLGTAGRRDYRARTRKKRNPLGRYPWACAVNGYVQRQLDEGAWRDSTAYERERLLYRIEDDLRKALGIEQVNPRHLNIEDVRTYIRWLRESSGRNGSTQRNSLLLLSEFMKLEVGNLSGERLRRQFPMDTPSQTKRPPFSDLVRGFDNLKYISDLWQRTICRGQAGLYIGTLIRPSEGRLAHRGDLDERAWVLRVRHPKGHTPERIAPFINDRCKTEMAQFLKERAEMLQSLGYQPNDPRLPLFPALEWGKEPHTYTPQSFNRIWAKAFPGLEHYCARRGMAQEAVDRDPKLLGAVSKILGHSNLQTTAKYYAETRVEQARIELAKVWSEPEEPIKVPRTRRSITAAVS